MHKIVLDTNVLISGIISTGYPYKILRNIIAPNRAYLVLSEDILNEYEAVINYGKFQHFPDFTDNAREILEHVKRIGHIYKPRVQLSVIKDLADNRFLELALIAKADFLITGNTKHFTFDEYNATTITSPKNYYEKYFKSPY